MGRDPAVGIPHSGGDPLRWTSLMPQLCTLMPLGGAAAAERAGGLGAILGACLFVGVSIPWRGTAEGAGDTPLQGHDNPVSGPPRPSRQPPWAQRPGAARREQQRRLPGRAGTLPALGPSRPVCARFPPIPQLRSAPLRPARLRLSAVRPQLPAQIRCRRAGRARKHLFPT